MGSEASRAVVQVGCVPTAHDQEYDETPEPVSRTGSKASSLGEGSCSPESLSPKSLGLDSDCSPRRSRQRWRPVEPGLDELADEAEQSQASQVLRDASWKLQDSNSGDFERPRRLAMSDALIETTDRFSMAEKDAATVESIKQLLSKAASEIFTDLKGDSFTELIQALYHMDFTAGTDIITQGDDGDRIYLIADGGVDIFVKEESSRELADATNDKGSKVATLGAGSIFGELAPLYNCPRCATCTAASPVVSVWALDATDFIMLKVHARQAEYEKYEGWLQNVGILRTLSERDLAVLADALRVHRFRKGTVILRQGDIGDRFFILAEGRVGAYMQGDEGEKEVKVYDTQGDYFGEMALLKACPRLATVRCIEDSVTLSVSKPRFEKLLGPVHEKLQTNSYPTYDVPSPLKKNRGAV
ncbi:unnamed protein product [Prorocentrum cordatum]|uniref:Cyclic nucleotide-binding domain-containing protein n=1 Tax=Prorocentrum cordatum TaxID=2364126 RepID=A0ABN9W8Z0_9DINO|nr:unnamed protein product [Polarella glacialis]